MPQDMEKKPQERGERRERGPRRDRRHELVTLDKGRGAGDCGIQTRWRFDGQRFSLSRYAQQPTCDNWQGPDAWPTLWITR